MVPKPAFASTVTGFLRACRHHPINAGRPAATVRSLSQRHDAERLRLALAGARAATFDWTIADDHVVWDGATDILSMHPDSDRLQSGETFRTWMNPEGRQKL